MKRPVWRTFRSREERRSAVGVSRGCEAGCVRDAKQFHLHGRRLVAQFQSVTPVDVDCGVFSLRLLPSAGVTPSGSYDPLCYEIRNLLGLYAERHRRNWERIRALLVQLEEDPGTELVGVSERVRDRSS